MTDTTDQQAVTVAQDDREAAALYWESQGIGSPETYVQICAGMRDDSHLVRAFARHRLASVSSASAEGFVLVPRDDDKRDLSDSILPTAMIDAGIEVLDKVQIDSLDYQAGTTTDWDDGMVAVAVYRAMLAATPEPVPATNQAGEVERLRMALHEIDVIAGNTIPSDGKQAAYGALEAITRLINPFRIPVLATQPATSQEGAAVNGLHPAPGHADGCGAHDDYNCDCAALATHPATSQEGESSAKPQCPYCNLTDVSFERTCHNSDCTAYALPETFYEGWKTLAAAPTPPTLSEDLREVERLIGEAKEFADCAQTDGFDPSDALDLIREFAALAQVKAS